uniref:Uncharacterized protein n=1 Tax=Utricularia reniformis TaxID=192314 RepID=A0A1Y0B4D1_9LAMI|nr:hypothetical protein AEK19_MT2094 [Utricularia reniformis]ART32248.1 hypothetical protein AEK19_MT2094 [Utricularia reniformis]
MFGTRVMKLLFVPLTKHLFQIKVSHPSHYVRLDNVPTYF